MWPDPRLGNRRNAASTPYGNGWVYMGLGENSRTGQAYGDFQLINTQGGYSFEAQVVAAALCKEYYQAVVCALLFGSTMPKANTQGEHSIPKIILFGGANAEGNTWKFNYDENYSVVSVSNPENSNAFGFEYAWTGSGSTQVTDGNGQTSIFYYDALNRVGSVTDPLGNSVLHEWNGRYQEVSITDGNGSTTTYSRDSRGNLLSVTDALGNTSSWTWDKTINRPIRYSDANGNVNIYEYDDNGNLTTVTDPLGQSTGYIYDEFGQILSKTDALNRQTQFTYDLNGNITQRADAIGGATSFTYDMQGNVIAVTNANGFQSSYTYDARNRLLKHVDELGGETQFIYDAEGNMISATDVRDLETQYTYNGLNRLSTQLDAMGGLTRYSYDGTGQLISRTDPGGRTIHFRYNAAGRMDMLTDGSGIPILYSHDASGKLIMRNDGLGNSTHFQYDAAGRSIRRTGPLGDTQHYEFDAAGNRTSMTDANGNLNLYSYDKNNRLVSVQNPIGGIETYSYDAVGNIVNRTDPMSQITSYEYDPLNRRTKMVTPMGNMHRFTYDVLGNMTGITDGNNTEVTYQFDGLNRITASNYPGGGDIRTYDVAGNLIELENLGGIGDHCYFAFDVLGRMIQKRVDYKGTVGEKVVDYRYDASGNLQSMTTPAGASFVYDYDGAGRVTQINTYDGVTTFEYDAAGRLIRQISPNGMILNRTYDENGRATDFEVISQSGEIFVQRSYGYDAKGNKIEEIRNDLNTYRQIQYNGISHPSNIVYGNGLDEEIPTEQIEDYAYNPAGRRLTKTVDGQLTSYTYNADGRLVTETTPDDVITYSHDGNGNRFARTGSNGNHEYYCDALNRLVEIHKPSGQYILNNYSPLGDILQRTVTYGGTPFDNYYVNSGYRPIEFYDDNELICRYNPGVGLEINMHTPDPTKIFAAYDPFATSAVDVVGDGARFIVFDEFGEKLRGSIYGGTWWAAWIYNVDGSLVDKTGFDAATVERIINNGRTDSVADNLPQFGSSFSSAPGYSRYNDVTLINNNIPTTLIGTQLANSNFNYSEWKKQFADFNYSDWKRNYTANETFDNSNYDFYDGSVVAPSTTGSGLRDIWINSTWMTKFTGMYQLPYGLDLTGFFQAREGNPQPLRHTASGLATGFSTDNYGRGSIGDDRLPTFWMLNLGLEKRFKKTDTVTATLVVDWYNVTNNTIELKSDLLPGIQPDSSVPILWNSSGLFQFGPRVNF